MYTSTERPITWIYRSVLDSLGSEHVRSGHDFDQKLSKIVENRQNLTCFWTNFGPILDQNLTNFDVFFMHIGYIAYMLYSRYLLAYRYRICRKLS